MRKRSKSAIGNGRMKNASSEAEHKTGHNANYLNTNLRLRRAVVYCCLPGTWSLWFVEMPACNYREGFWWFHHLQGGSTLER